jgi:hypothetical protein
VGISFLAAYVFSARFPARVQGGSSTLPVGTRMSFAVSRMAAGCS